MADLFLGIFAWLIPIVVLGLVVSRVAREMDEHRQKRWQEAERRHKEILEELRTLDAHIVELLQWQMGAEDRARDQVYRDE